MSLHRFFISLLILGFSAICWAQMPKVIPKEVPKELLERPEFFSKMSVIENLELLENATDSDITSAATVADIPEVSPPAEIGAEDSDD